MGVFARANRAAGLKQGGGGPGKQRLRAMRNLSCKKIWLRRSKCSETFCGCGALMSVRIGAPLRAFVRVSMNTSGIEITEVMPKGAGRFLLVTAIACLLLACLGLVATLAEGIESRRY